MEETDVIILGAGVAGLFAAYELVKQHFKGTITLVEQGLSMEERLSLGNTAHETFRGVGGPGFFSDGKICLSENAGTRLTNFIDNSILKDYVDYAWGILKDFLPGEHLFPSYDVDALEPLESKLQTLELEIGLSYPVVNLGSERARLLASSFEEFLRSHGVCLLTGTTAQEIKPGSDTIEIRIDNAAGSKLIRCRHLIAAVGKSGHDWLINQFKQWDIELKPNTPDIGIRLEFPNEITEPLLRIAQNPRIVMNWNNSYIKTHCWCYGAKITTYDYLDYTLVDGETFQSKLTPYTCVSLLYHFVGHQDPVRAVRKLLQEFFQLSQGYPLVQSLGALRGDRQRHNPFKGSVSSKIFQKAKIEHFFPKVILDGFLEFIRRIDVLYPGIADGSTLVYAPALEWDTYQVSVDENMLTSIPNIYAVGDGAGLSQGVITAATSGLIAAKHLSQTYLNARSGEELIEAVN